MDDFSDVEAHLASIRRWRLICQRVADVCTGIVVGIAVAALLGAV